MGFSQRQLFALALVAVLVVNMTLFAFRKTSEMAFWAVLAGCAVLWFVLKGKLATAR